MSAQDAFRLPSDSRRIEDGVVPITGSPHRHPPEQRGLWVSRTLGMDRPASLFSLGSWLTGFLKIGIQSSVNLLMVVRTIGSLAASRLSSLAG